jgi:membrane associated rhomboid family serine protease
MGGMIPLADESRRPVSLPVATTTIICINVVVFILELMGGDQFVTRWSEIPAQVVAGHRLITLLTSIFLHAGVMHIVGNMVFLHAFGPRVEDAMGAVRYSIFYLLCGLAASLAQTAVMPQSTLPSLGASGAIAGVMGAFIVISPGDEIKTLWFFGFFVRVTFIPAFLLIGVWFLIQLFDQVGSLADVQSGGVAYAAHVGGFLFGAITGRLFARSRDSSEW